MIISACNDDKGILHNLKGIRIKAKSWNMHTVKSLLIAKNSIM